MMSVGFGKKRVKKGGSFIIMHSLSRRKINGFHENGSVSTLSSLLEPVEAEANKFSEFFITESLIDNDEFYFIKMKRR